LGVNPQTLYWGPKNFFERYKLPIYITENGMANVDWVALDGKVHDPQRIDFLTVTFYSCLRPAKTARISAVFPMVADGQLRMGQWLPGALWHGLR